VGGRGPTHRQQPRCGPGGAERTVTRRQRTFAGVIGAIIGVGALIYLDHQRPAAPLAPAATPTAAIAAARPGASAAKSTRPTQLLESATAEEWLAALEHRIGSGATSEEILDDLRFLLHRRPGQAIDLALALARSGEEKYEWVAALLSEWSVMDPNAAWDRALDLNRTSAVVGEPDVRSVVLSRIAQLDPDKVVGLADAMLARTPDEPAKGGANDVAQLALRALLQAQQPELARRTLERWATDGHAEALGNAPFEEVALDFARRSRHDAADWLQSLPPSSGRDFALATVAADWTAAAPGEAMTWATSLETPAARNDAMQRVFNRWAQSDIVAAVQWLGDHEAHPEADKLIANLVIDSSLSEVAPERALQWSSLIGDPAARSASIQQVLLRWGEKDADAAIKFAQTTPLLDDTLRQRTLQILQRRPPPNE
jgi:hypothetical protein